MRTDKRGKAHTHNHLPPLRLRLVRQTTTFGRAQIERRQTRLHPVSLASKLKHTRTRLAMTLLRPTAAPGKEILDPEAAVVVVVVAAKQRAAPFLPVL